MGGWVEGEGWAGEPTGGACRVRPDHLTCGWVGGWMEEERRI